MKPRGLLSTVVVVAVIGCAALSFCSIKTRSERLRITSLLRSITAHVLQSHEFELSDRWTEVPFDLNSHKAVLDTTKPGDADAIAVYLREDHGRREARAIHMGRDGVFHSSDDISAYAEAPGRSEPIPSGLDSSANAR